jgi:hypothetical protein
MLTIDQVLYAKIDLGWYLKDFAGHPLYSPSVSPKGILELRKLHIAKNHPGLASFSWGCTDADIAKLNLLFEEVL